MVLFSVTYNIPKFFELTTENVTVNANSTPCTRNLATNLTFVDLRPTWLRTNPHYVRIYILWMNLFFHIVGPFVVLVIMNLRIYKRIKDFEVILHFGSVPQLVSWQLFIRRICTFAIAFIKSFKEAHLNL